jgi:hypothetical protein
MVLLLLVVQKKGRIGVSLSGQKQLRRLVCTFVQFLCGFQLRTVIWFLQLARR